MRTVQDAALAIAAAALLGLYLLRLATRHDRLLTRVELARESLDTQLVRRSAAAQLISRSPSAAPELAALGHVADAALAAAQGEREAAESALTRALRAALEHGALAPVDRDALAGLAGRVRLARQLHNDAVFATLALRRRRVLRSLRLYGRSRAPAYFDIDDTLDG